MITSKQRSLIGLAALVAFASVQACGASDAPTNAGTAGAAAGAHNGAAGSVGGSAPGAAGGPAGAPAFGGGGAGGAAAGSPSFAGGGAAGAPVGAGGSSAGSGTGGSSAGSAGHAAGGAAGGGSSSTVPFADVKAIFGSSCATSTNKCHDSASGHTNFASGDLYMTLTTALPAGTFQLCKGTTLVTPGDAANSFLTKVIAGKSTCKDSGKDSSVDRMPDKCGGASPAPACLTAAQIKTISDWITGNAPK